MIELEIKPHEGMGPIKLGASRNDVRKALAGVGFPLNEEREQLDYFCDHAIQVGFDEDNKAQFIGAWCNPAYSVTYRATNVFDVPAEELFAFIASKDESGPHEFNPSEYEFPNQIVTLWEADEQYDRLGGEKRPIWGQVGLGNKRYLQTIREIRSR